VYFAAFTGRIELWRSDGTPAGTLAVTSDPGVEYANTHIAELDGRVYFAAAARGAPPMAVWSTDGTPQGTRPAFSNPPAGFDPIQVWSTKTHLFMLSAS